MEIGLCVCAFTWAFAWAMCVVFHRKSMIFHSIFSHRIRLSVYWRIKTQLQEHARKSASFPSMVSGSMCSQFFNHMKRCDGRDVWSETDGNDVTKCFGYDFSCLSLLEAEKEIEKKVRAHKHTHTHLLRQLMDFIAGFSSRLRLPFTAQCTCSMYIVQDMSVWTQIHVYTATSDTTSIEAIQTSIDKMLYYRYFETCILCDRPYGVADFQFVVVAFFSLARNWSSILDKDGQQIKPWNWKKWITHNVENTETILTNQNNQPLFFGKYLIVSIHVILNQFQDNEMFSILFEKINIFLTSKEQQ